MLTHSKRMSGIGDRDTNFVLELEVAGVRHYFGERSLNITNRFGRPTVLHVIGANLVDAFTKGFDIATDLSTDTSVAITDLRVPASLAVLFQRGAGETMAGARAELSVVRDGEDWSQRWVQAAGSVENPTIMSTEAVENAVSFSIDQEDGVRFDFPSKDYLIAPGFLSSTDTVRVADAPEDVFGFEPDDVMIGDLDWSAENFLFGAADVYLTMPAAYADSPVSVPFVFGKPGVEANTVLSKDLDGDAFIDDLGDFAVGGDEGLRYFTTPGQLIAALTLGHSGVTDPDVDSDEGGTPLADIMEELDSSFVDNGAGDDVDLSDLVKGASTYVFGHQDVCLWARVAVHAGEAAQIGSTLYMVDRKNLGTPYSTSGTVLPQLGHTASGAPYTYVDIKVDYTGYFSLLQPTSRTNTGRAIHVVHDGAASKFKILGLEVSPLSEDDVDNLWYFAYCCWVGAMRAGANTAQMLEAFFSNPEVQRIIEDKDGDRTWQDYHFSAFNLAMTSGNRYTVKYPTADPLDNHCPGSWTAGGQTFLDGAVIENPAELIMHMSELAGLAYDRGSFFELRDQFRNWKLGGFLDDVTDVLDYVTGVLQTYLPFTLGKSPQGITATYWKWDASRLDACHHFVEGIDLEMVGDGVVVEEAGMIRSLRLHGRSVSWLHQASAPFATTKPVEDAVLTAKDLKKLNRLRSNIKNTSHPHNQAGKERALQKFERHLRSTYGSWDFSQTSEVTEQQDFWRVNNYTGDVEAASQGRWSENPLTFPVEDETLEQWSRFMPSPLLIAAFRRWAKTTREDLVLELDDVYDLNTMQRVADWIIAARSQPGITFQGIAAKRRAWIVEGDVVRVTSSSYGYVDQVCLVVRKGWQATNVLFEFRPLRIAARDTVPEVAVPAEVDEAPLVLWDFETAGEGAGGTGTFVNQGSYAVTANITSVPTRVTDQFYEGVASCRFNFASSFGFSLSGATDLDVDAEGITIEFAYRPNTLSGAAIIFDWGDTNPTRFGIYIDAGEPKAYVGHAGVYTFVTSGGFTVSNVTWATWKLQLVPSGVATLIIDGVVRGTGSLPGPFTVAELGNLLRWGCHAFTNASHCDGWIDSFRWRRGIH